MSKQNNIQIEDVLNALSEAKDKLTILDKLMGLLGPNGMARTNNEQDEIYSICRRYWEKYLGFENIFTFPLTT